MDTYRSRSKLLDRLSFGAFFVIFGLIWLSKDYFEIDMWAAGLLLAGIILIFLNLGRAAWRIKVSSGSLGLGVLAAFVGVAMIRGLTLNWIGLFLVLLGLWISLDALAKRR